MTNRTFDLLAEAACCAWEAMLEQREQIPALEAAWRNRGTVHMRHRAIALAPVICDMYDLLGENWIASHDLIPYDWEFVPAIIKIIPWYDDSLPDTVTLVAWFRDKYAKTLVA